MRHRVLIASQPEAWAKVERMLDSAVDLVPAHTMMHAFAVLEREAGRIELIICTIAFDDSRMIDFLRAVKRNPASSAVPFLCARVLRGVLSDNMVGRMNALCKDCGALDFLDIAKLDERDAKAALKAAVLEHCHPMSP